MHILLPQSKSMINLKQWSHKLSDKFNEFCLKLEDDAVKGDRIRNMRHREHRYDSVQTPLGRLIISSTPSSWLRSGVW